MEQTELKMTVDKIKNWHQITPQAFIPKQVNEWSYFAMYQKKVKKLSKKVYHMVKDSHLVYKGSGYSFDHIIPINYGWKHKVRPEVMADVSNLQVLPMIKNRMKGDKIDYEDARTKDLLVFMLANTAQTE